MRLDFRVAHEPDLGDCQLHRACRGCSVEHHDSAHGRRHEHEYARYGYGQDDDFGYGYGYGYGSRQAEGNGSGRDETRS